MKNHTIRSRSARALTHIRFTVNRRQWPVVGMNLFVDGDHQSGDFGESADGLPGPPCPGFTPNDASKTMGWPINDDSRSRLVESRRPDSRHLGILGNQSRAESHVEEVSLLRPSGGWKSRSRWAASDRRERQARYGRPVRFWKSSRLHSKAVGSTGVVADDRGRDCRRP